MSMRPHESQLRKQDPATNSRRATLSYWPHLTGTGLISGQRRGRCQEPPRYGNSMRLPGVTGTPNAGVRDSRRDGTDFKKRRKNTHMGTRADFYIGRGKDAKWLGSQAWDGCPEGIADSLLEAKTESEFRQQIVDHFEGRRDVTLPKDGWPWPWKDSGTTDFAYAFDDGRVFISSFGHGWRTYEHYKTDGDQDHFWDSVNRPKVEFPDMQAMSRLAVGASKSGIIIIG